MRYQPATIDDRIDKSGVLGQSAIIKNNIIQIEKCV
jgi:hypothetical protein